MTNWRIGRYGRIQLVKFRLATSESNHTQIGYLRREGRPYGKSRRVWLGETPEVAMQGISASGSTAQEYLFTLPIFEGDSREQIFRTLHLPGKVLASSPHWRWKQESGLRMLICNIQIAPSWQIASCISSNLESDFQQTASHLPAGFDKLPGGGGTV